MEPASRLKRGSRPIHFKGFISLSLGGLECGANGISTIGRICGTYADLLCGAMSFTVVVNTVFNIAGYTLDVSAFAAVGFVHGIPYLSSPIFSAEHVLRKQ